MSRYIQPMVVLDEPDASEEKKPRIITLHKGPMEKEIDSHTSKFVDAAQLPSLQQQNAVSSDTDEALDGSVISRLMVYRDARLRMLLQAFMQEETEYEVNNLIQVKPVFVYKMAFSADFRDSNLQPLAMLMHKYIVWGCLFDWYTQLGMAQASTYGAQLDGISDEIMSMVSPEGYEKRPLQPFGPAYKI